MKTSYWNFVFIALLLLAFDLVTDKIWIFDRYNTPFPDIFIYVAGITATLAYILASDYRESRKSADSQPPT
jgi:hypothetical protein